MPEDNIPSQEEVDAILGEVSVPEEIRMLETDEERKVAAKIIPILAGKANALADAKRAKLLNEEIAMLRDQNSKMIQAELERIKESSKPPSLADIGKLLNQEYLEVTFELKDRKSNATRSFVIQELPQAAEERFLKIIQTNLIPRIREFTGIEWTNTSTTADRLQKILDIFPDALETMAELAAVALDPYKEDPDISKEWVRKNLGTYRILMVIQAQVETGRFRDFLLQVWKSIPQTQTA